MCMQPQSDTSAQPLQDSWLPKLTANHCAHDTAIVSNQDVLKELKWTKAGDTPNKQPESSKAINLKDI